MRSKAATLLVGVTLMCLPAFGQVKAVGGEAPKEYVSPLELSIPVTEHFVKGGTWQTSELKAFVCEAVSIEKILVHRILTKQKKKNDYYTVTFTVTTFTRPGVDKLATISFLFKNDEEELKIYPRARRGKPFLKINAEEKKTRRKSIEYHVDAEDLQRVLEGPNPHLEISLVVEVN